MKTTTLSSIKAVINRFLQAEDLKYALTACAKHIEERREDFHAFVNHRNKFGYTVLHNAVAIQ